MHAATLAEVLARFGPAYLATYRLPRGAAKVWRAILACRTAALGGHLEACDRCGASRHVYHSCRNRHCPRCQSRAKQAWVAARRAEVLPVPYFHLVFTLPHDLNALIGTTPRPLYETLFGAVSATLTEFAASPRHLGGVAAFSLLLHTGARIWAATFMFMRWWPAGRWPQAGSGSRQRRVFCFRCAHCPRCFAASSSPDSICCAAAGACPPVWAHCPTGSL
ncbi:MAG: transposase zinc-binding domain-containing protein [Sterolibacteriaceae bacterium]|nr:transposase zinc-binding domain-containing protein [Sterolibacteriaceae bacterium]